MYEFDHLPRQLRKWMKVFTMVTFSVRRLWCKSIQWFIFQEALKVLDKAEAYKIKKKNPKIKLR